jgi:hypothetical protein
MATLSIHPLTLPSRVGSGAVDLVRPCVTYLQANYGAAEAKLRAGGLGELEKTALAVRKPNTPSTPMDTGLLETYLARLEEFSLLFPVQQDGLRVNFSWGSSLQRGSVVGVSLVHYEVANVLQGLGCSLLFQAALAHSDAKRAVLLLQCAAGAFQRLALHLGSAAPYDARRCPELTEGAARACEHLALGLAQERILHTAMSSDPPAKDEVVARLAAQAADWLTACWSETQQHQPSFMPADVAAAVKDRAVALRLLEDERMAAVEEAAQEIGAMIARLTIAQQHSKLSEASKERLARGVKENNLIYHQATNCPVPKTQRATLVKPLPATAAAAERPPPLFPGMLSLPDQRKRQAFADEVSKAVAAERAATQGAVAAWDAGTAQLGVPALFDAVVQSGPGLPKELHARLARGASVADLEERLQAVTDQAREARRLHEEARKALTEEAASDAEMRARFGARWARASSEKEASLMFARLDRIKAEHLDPAARADQDIAKKLADNREGFALLARPLAELEASLPAAVPAGGPLSQKVAQLRELFAEGARAVAEGIPDAERALAAAATAHDLQAARAGLEALRARLGELQAALRPGVQEMRTLSETSTDMTARLARISNLQGLATAFDSVASGLNQGMTFYAELNNTLTIFTTCAKDWVFARGAESRELLAHIQRMSATQALGGENGSGIGSIQQQQQASSQPYIYSPEVAPNDPHFAREK